MLSDLQNRAIKDIKKWLKDDNRQIYMLGGIAGSGKTYTLNVLIKELNLRAYTMSLSGKAVIRMIESGMPNSRTIHSTIYSTKINEEGEYIPERKGFSSFDDVDLFIIDEYSMLTKKIFDDLIFFKKKILFVGDPEQLTLGKNNLDNNLDFFLNECHRTALENPITWLSKQIRDDNFRLKNTVISNNIMISNKTNTDVANRANIILTATHKNRIAINKIMRNFRGLDRGSELQDEDVVICKKNNWNKNTTVLTEKLNLSLFLVNGLRGKVYNIRDNGIIKYFCLKDRTYKELSTLKIDFYPELGGEYKDLVIDQCSIIQDKINNIKGRCKADFFERGYAITVHSSQGSEYDKVYYQHKPFGSAEMRKRFLYTAVTRTKEKLYLEY